MTRRTTVAMALVLVCALATWWLLRGGGAGPEAAATPETTTGEATTGEAEMATTSEAPSTPARHDRVRPVPHAGRDVIDGRVLDAVTREGVGDAELTFAGDAGVATYRTSADGTFQIVVTAEGRLELSTITAPGYLPYVTAVDPSRPRLTLVRGPAVHGVTLLVEPAVDYEGVVVDARGAPAAGARIRMIGNRAGTPMPDDVAAEWRAGADGRFTFQAAFGSVLEASRGALRGSAIVEPDLAGAKQLTIQLGHLPPRDAAITGRVRDADGAPVAGAVVRARPSTAYGDLEMMFATTGADGAFLITGVDRASYDLLAQTGDARGRVDHIMGGSRDVEIRLANDLPLAGRVVDGKGAPVPSFMLLVRRRIGMESAPFMALSVLDPEGRFALAVPDGRYDLLASRERAVTPLPTPASAGATDVRIVLGGGALLRGRVIASDDRQPIAGATVACDGPRARRFPAENPSTVTGADGTFELPAMCFGSPSVRIRAEGFHGRLEGAMTVDGSAVTIALTRLGPHELPLTEMVGIGVGFYPDGNALRVYSVTPGGGAADAGLSVGDRVIAIDGQLITTLGADVALSRIRGTAGTSVTLTVLRDRGATQVVVERRPLRT